MIACYGSASISRRFCTSSQHACITTVNLVKSVDTGLYGLSSCAVSTDRQSQLEEQAVREACGVVQGNKRTTLGLGDLVMLGDFLQDIDPISHVAVSTLLVRLLD